jgi:protease I
MEKRLKILMLLAEKDFRDVEYLVPRAFFERSGAEVCTLSGTEIATGRFGYRVKTDFLLPESADLSVDFDGVFIVGGSGVLDYEKNDLVEDLIKNFVQEKKPVAAICAAPRNLLKWGLLAEKKFTGWNGDNFFPGACAGSDAIFVDEEVVVDGKLVTGNGPEAAEVTALSFLSVLGEPKKK